MTVQDLQDEYNSLLRRIRAGQPGVREKRARLALVNRMLLQAELRGLV